MATDQRRSGHSHPRKPPYVPNRPKLGPASHKRHRFERTGACRNWPEPPLHGRRYPPMDQHTSKFRSSKRCGACIFRACSGNLTCGGVTAAGNTYNAIVRVGMLAYSAAVVSALSDTLGRCWRRLLGHWAEPMRHWRSPGP